MTVFLHLWSDSKPRVRIYVEHHYNWNQEFFIWIPVDNMKLGEKGSLPLLLEDPLISETCSLEESASHHRKMLTKSLLCFCIRGRIQNLEWTQLESTSKIAMVDVENSSCGYNLII